MFSKLSTKTLLILMAILGAIVWFTYFSDNGSDESTFRNEFISMDTSSVNSILIYPKAEDRKEIKFIKANNKWEVTNGKITASVDSMTVRSLLGQFALLKSQSLAAISSDKWDDLLVSDTSGTRIKFITPSKTYDIMVGKFGYNNETRSGITYVRMYDEKEVYTVDGFLSFNVNQPFNSWRNHNLTKGNQQDWQRIAFIYAGDSSFVMVKDSIAGWTIEGQRCDSAEAANYIQSIAYLSSSEFIDNYSPGANQPVCQLRIEGNNQSAITLQAFPADTTIQFVLHSSINPDSYFNDAKSKIAEKAFVSKSRFLK